MRQLVVVACLGLVAVVAASRVTLEADVFQGVPAEWQPEAKLRAKPNELIELLFAVKQQNVDQLEAALLRVSDPRSADYGKHLSLKQVDEMVAPAAASVRAVEHWLTQHGLTVAQRSGNSDWIKVITTIEKAEALLSVEYHHFTHGASGETVVRCDREYSVPAAVAPHLDLVAPTWHFPAVRRARLSPQMQRKQAAGAPADLFVDPPFLHALYNVPNNTRGKDPSNVQAIASFLEQYWTPSDLQEFFALFQNSSVGDTVAKVIGDNDPTNPGTEAELDIQYIMGVGAGVTTWAYYTKGRAPNPANEPFLTWLLEVGTEDPIPNVFSVSYGEDEKSVGLSYGSRVNTEFMKVGARGSSIMVAAGDDGTGGNCSSSGRFTPDFPSGSPYVTAVGGVVGGTPGQSPTGETADYISGGGFSDYWSQPSWQTAAVAEYFKVATNLPPPNVYNKTGRGYPDVAAQSEMFVVVQGGIPLPGVGGTSCASPTFTGVVALLNDLRLAAGKSALGFLNPLLYQLGPDPKHVNALNDITSGTNAGCSLTGFTCAKGWDPVTGWGSPNYGLLAKAVLSLP